jgi:quercetin dioxygenase-like cupin family protein
MTESIMRIHPALFFPLLAALLPGATAQTTAPATAPSSAAADPDPAVAAFYDAARLNWSEAPPVLPRGAQVAVLDGDPFQAGPYVIRLKMPPGYRIPPHWHTRAENVTVISGTLSIGMGDTLDMAAAHALRTGGFHAIAPLVHHYAFSRSGAVIQIHGEGPFDITYVNPADNPEPNARQSTVQ